VVAAWTNLHASFFLAPLIALLYALAHWARPLIWDVDRAAEHARARWFLLAALVSAAATLVNPYGWQLHRHVAAYLGDSELLGRIGEFQSFNFHAEGALQILLTVAVAMAGGVAALAQKRLAHFLMAALLTAAALRSARGLPLVALLVLPIAGGAITSALETARVRWPLRLRFDAFLAYSRRLRAIDNGLGGWVWAVVAIGLAGVWLSVPAVAARTGFPPDQFPVAAAGRVAALPDGARLLAPDKFGGYLIYRFAGRRKVFFDGRSDLYGSEFMKQYARLMQVRPGWREQLDAYRFTHALLPNDYSLIPALESLGWTPLYRDSVATLLEKP
ncbi:MAG: hypothetical protein ACRD8O_14800, partial [Bryobacteraceae bacterium]